MKNVYDPLTVLSNFSITSELFLIFVQSTLYRVSKQFIGPRVIWTKWTCKLILAIGGEVILIKLLSDEWPGVIRQQAITLTDDDPYLWCHMASLVHTVLHSTLLRN